MSVRLAPGLRPLSSREERLDVLLTHYPSACDEIRRTGRDSTAESVHGAPGEATGLLPAAWAPFRELDRCLSRMRRLAEEPGVASPQFRRWYVNLRRWYFEAMHKRMPLLRRDRKSHRPYHVMIENVPQYTLVLLREGDPEQVLKAIGWLDLDHIGDVPACEGFRDAA